MSWSEAVDELLRRTVEDQELRAEYINSGFLEPPSPDDPERPRYDELRRQIHGDWQPQPVENIDVVDALRAEVGLGRLADYRQVIADNERTGGFVPKKRPATK